MSTTDQTPAENAEKKPEDPLKEDNKSNTSKPKVKSKDSKSSRSSTKHCQNANITLTEDCFGGYYYEDGNFDKVQRFTWKNHNNIEVEVITYGARIVSMRMPDKKKIVEDIVLGFKDLAGYIYYDNYKLGATVGRVTSYVENSTFAIDGKQYWLSSNSGKHHYNGGFYGLDKVIWTPYVDGTKVIMSYTCPDGTEGYPGDLLIRITYELSTMNEFTIRMEAMSSKPTIINLSNLLYFNLAGHYRGAEEIYNHTVTINANCYTMYDDDQFPTGDIQNVYNTRFDFQQPVILKGCLGVKPDDGIDQNYCVNRGVDQGNCFVSRSIHIPTGRILEVYSNQHGVNFSTANDFGTGQVNIPVPPSICGSYDDSMYNNIFVLLDRLYEIILDTPDMFASAHVDEIRQLVRKIQLCKFKDEPCILSSLVGGPDVEITKLGDMEFDLSGLVCTLQKNYLEAIKCVAAELNSNTSGNGLQVIVDKIIAVARSFDKPEQDIWNSKGGSAQNIAVENKQEVIQADRDVIQKLSSFVAETSPDAGSTKGSAGSGNRQADDNGMHLSASKESSKKKHATKERPKPTNTIPSFYKDGRIHGKNNAIYKRHGAIAFQTQNYPNAIYHTNFPNSILRPGETYTHTIVYKLWVQSGNPNKWMKRQGCLKND